MKVENKESKSMDSITLILAIIAVGLLVIAYFRGRGLPMTAISNAGRTLLDNLPLILLGFLIAGLVQVLVPRELITRLLGAQSGIKGVLISCLAGGLMPGPPYAIYPLVASFYQAGASLGVVVGFVSAWSLWSVSRLPIEMALLDPKAAIIRYGITFVVPPIAGMIANFVSRLI